MKAPKSRLRWPALLTLSILQTALACTESKPAAKAEPSPLAPIRNSSALPQQDGINPFEDLSVCRVGHFGPFIDLGQTGAPGLPAFRLQPKSGLKSDSWQGQNHTHFERRTAVYDFWTTETIERPRLLVRAQAGSARRLSLSLDDRLLGTSRLKTAQFETLRFSGQRKPLLAGRHRIRVRWRGRQRGTYPAYGLIRWLEVRDINDPTTETRTPQHQSLWSDVSLSGTVRRSLILRHPSSVACPVVVNAQSVLHLGIGFWGEGKGIAHIAALRDGKPPIALGEYRVEGGPEARFRVLDIPLGSLGNEPFHLQLRAARTSGPGAIVFGEPTIGSGEHPQSVPPAKLALVVLLGGLHQSIIPPVSKHQLPTLRRFATSQTRFSNYRAPTTYVGGVVASMLTGRHPIEHSLHRRRIRLSDRHTALPALLRAASGSSALFTAVPQTRADFGFQEGWNHFESYSPVDDLAATAPLQAAQAWLLKQPRPTTDSRRLIVIHLRGAHPPWDLSRSELPDLPPEDYNGILEARRGGTLLSSVRNRRRRSSRRLTNADWVRLRALQQQALSKQDRALGTLFEKLRGASLWDEALVIVAGDVGTEDPPGAPFGDGRRLTEARLTVPLWIKFPHERESAGLVAVPVASVDLAETLATSLGLRLPTSTRPGSAQRNDLYSLAHNILPPTEAPLIAVREDSYATRWGSWLLRGTSPKAPLLCEVEVDPACSSDLRKARPLLTEALWKKTFQALVAESQKDLPGQLRPASLTPATSAALRVWGD